MQKCKSVEADTFSSVSIAMENESEGKNTNTYGFDFLVLPEECIASILALTSPLDACRSSIVSRLFCAIAESDAVWDRFIPSDYRSIISRSDSSSSLLAAFSSSKKALYLVLSDPHQPIIIDHGNKSFQLDRRSGKKCYMLAARDLHITWGDTPEYWNWTTLPGSRFQEVAKLIDVCWLEIRGKINSVALSPDTQYAAYLVFKMIDAYGFLHRPVELSVGVYGGHSTTKNICLDPNFGERELHRSLRGLQRPVERSDGWLEIEMGEFFNLGLEDEQVEMSVLETRGGNWKRGLCVQGIEVRPKDN